MEQSGRLGRRAFLGGAAAGVGGIGPGRAQPAPVRIGVLEDMSTAMASVYGQGSVIAAELALEDFGPEVAGRRIELVSADHRSKPDIATAIAREWFDQQGVSMITGLDNSAIALSVQALAREKNRISIITGSGATEITGAQCSPNGLHWVIDAYALAHAVPRPLLAAGDKTWFNVVADITLGKSLVKEITPVIEAGGGRIVGQVFHPLLASDLSSFIIEAQSSRAQVIGLFDVGGDAVNAIKQASEFGVIAGGQKLAGLWLTVTDIHAVGLPTAQQIYFAEAFYWDQDDQARAWSKRFMARAKAAPNSFQAGVYGAIAHYLKAVRRAGTTDAAEVMASMRALPVQDFMTHDGVVRIDGRVIRDVHILQAKRPEESQGEWDLARIVGTLPGPEAFRPLAQSDCPLVKR